MWIKKRSYIFYAEYEIYDILYIGEKSKKIMKAFKVFAQQV